ncbi:hypothetical protein GYMLUDRAFT_64826 [Collybiopsis luxurians FD-317 M1]|uniref:Uncharacterized protein n=1 Tax=Collybiopsis luxurians FD-317 M1 TaxID=944289 RepID=A0A0D0BPF0_9AGAR|nr:hypothetical protein GYMLUDRAFT_64826 [Collybiopsis luxurians FD-317 M1]
MSTLVPETKNTSVSLPHSSPNPVPSLLPAAPDDSGTALDAMCGAPKGVPLLPSVAPDYAVSEDFHLVQANDMECNVNPVPPKKSDSSAVNDILSVQAYSSASDDSFEHVEHISSGVELLHDHTSSSPAAVSCDLLGRTLRSCPSTPVQSRCNSPYHFPASTASTSPCKRLVWSPSPFLSPVSVSSPSPSKCSRTTSLDDNSSSPSPNVPDYIVFHGMKFFPAGASPPLPSPTPSPSQNDTPRPIRAPPFDVHDLDHAQTSAHHPVLSCERAQFSDGDLNVLNFTARNVRDAPAVRAQFPNVASHGYRPAPSIPVPSLSFIHHHITDEELDNLNIDLPENLDDIPALRQQFPSTPSSRHRLHHSSPMSPSSAIPLVVGSPSPSPAKVPSARSSASQARLAAITKALSEGNSGGASAHNSPPSSTHTSVPNSSSPLPSPTLSFASRGTHPSNFVHSVPTSVSSIHTNISSDSAFVACSVASNVDNLLSDEPLFDDSGLGADGCLKSHLMAPELVNTYQNVKNRLMPLVYPIASAGVPTDDLDWLSFSSIFSGLTQAVRRADPSCVTVVNTDKGPRLPPAEDNHFTAVFLTSGLVKRSRIYDPVVFDSGSTKRVLHQLDLSPFEQEAQLMLGFFAAALNFTEIALAVSEGIVTFTSMQHFSNEVKSNPTDYSPSTQNDDPRLKIWSRFRHAVPFSSPIPVYDGRTSAANTAFEASPNQLHEIRISSYPLYKGGMVDLPQGSLVAVGYTAHTFPTTRHYRDIPSGLSLNLAFVILLSLPAAGDELDPPVSFRPVRSPSKRSAPVGQSSSSVPSSSPLFCQPVAATSVQISSTPRPTPPSMNCFPSSSSPSQTRTGSSPICPRASTVSSAATNVSNVSATSYTDVGYSMAQPSASVDRTATSDEAVNYEHWQ